jgi:T5SS/PEP-CTERM-associated repeat protein
MKLSYLVAAALVVPILTAEAGISASARSSQVTSSACAPLCDPKDADLSEPLLGTQKLERESSSSFEERSALGRASVDTQVSVSGNALTFSGTLNGRSSVTGEGSGIGTGRVTLSGSTDSAYSFRITGNITGTNNQDTANQCSVRISGNGRVFEQNLNGSGSRSLTGSGVLRDDEGGSFSVELRFVTLSEKGGESSSATMNFTIEFTPGNPPTPPIRWVNAAGGSFQEASNWDPQLVPGPTNDAAFDLAGAYTVSFDSNVQTNALLGNGQGGNVTFELNGRTLMVNRLQVGGLIGESQSFTFSGVFAPAIPRPDGLAGVPQNGGSGPGGLVQVVQQIRLEEGNSIAFREGARNLAPLVDVEGSLTVGDEGTLLITPQLNVGIDADEAALTIKDRGRVVSTNASIGIDLAGSFTGGVGTVNILGPGSLQLNEPSWKSTDNLIVAKGGTGNVTVEGGALEIGGKCIIGDDADSVGSIELKGVSSSRLSANTSEWFVGRAGKGTLRIEGPSFASIGVLHIGHDPDDAQSGGEGTVDVTFSRSALSVIGDVFVGGSGKGRLNVTLGSFGNGEVAPNAPPLTTVFNDGEIQFNVGIGAFAGIRIEDGGLLGLKANSAVSVARMTTLGNVILEGGSGLLVRQRLTIQGTGIVSVEAQSRVTVGEGAGVNGRLRVGPGGVLAGDGTIIAEELIVAGSGSNQFVGGIIQPGNSPGTLTLQGNLIQEPGGRLVMEAAGVNAGQFDVLRVTGNSTIGGTLEVLFVDGYLPKAGDSFAFLEIGGNVTGSFAEVVFPQIARGFEVETRMEGGQFQLTALSDAVLLPVKGVFQGVLAGDPANHDSGGVFTIRLGSRDRFSTRFILGGHKFSLKGEFDASGQFSQSIARAGASPLTVTLQRPADVTGVISGTISDGVHTIAIAADRANPLNSKKNPAPQAGKYTAVLQFDASVSDSPQANGIGVVKVSKTGAIRFTGTLPDGTTLSQGSALSRAGEWPLFISLYKKQGSLVGTLQFRNEGGSDFDGLVRWSRPATPENSVQTAGFFAMLPTIGSRYVAPPARNAILDLPTGGTVTLSDADLVPGLSKNVTLIPPDKFMVTDAGPDGLTFRATAANGLLFPQFTHPVTGLLTKGRSVVIQKQNFGSGFFLRPGGVGSFELQANP